MALRYKSDMVTDFEFFVAKHCVLTVNICHNSFSRNIGSELISGFTVWKLPGGGGTPYNGLYGEAPPERGTRFRLEVYKRVEISRVEV